MATVQFLVPSWFLAEVFTAEPSRIPYTSVPYMEGSLTQLSPLERIEMAIQRIRTKGWTTAQMENINGAGCLVRSLLTDSENEYRKDYRDWLSLCEPAFRAVITALYFRDIEAAMRWNDKQDSVWPVLARLEAARDELLNRELHHQADLGMVSAAMPEFTPTLCETR